ncbi:50S ribosomal protein L4 [Candidatus Woesearchaeota archaeon]|nr:50S ribosomal protein L4 [Candidatus Woesearchaeota archaeon]
MKLPIYTTEKKKVGECTLPAQLQESYRPDLIRRAVRAVLSRQREVYGKKSMAGMRHSTVVSKRRRDYKTSYGFGMSRAARKVLSHRGTRMSWVGAFTPQTRGGRRAHPSKTQAVLEYKINDKENRKALRSAAAANFDATLVQLRGHKIPSEYPFIVDSAFEEIKKTNEFEGVLLKLGFTEELQRSAQKKIRAGKGKLRGRKYQQKKGLLLVVSKMCPLVQAAKNIPGIDIVQVQALHAAVLAPGAMPGRVTLWTEAAVQRVEKENLWQ